MDKIVVYTIGCPNCNWLETNLKKLNIKYETVTNEDEMRKMGMKSAPAMTINDGKLMYIPQIRQWVKEQFSLKVKENANG